MTHSAAPLVSVVLPVYCQTVSHEEFLVEALESVARQTFRDFDVVIVDDQSPREIVPLVESVQGLGRTRILRNAANVGHAQSRNVGIRAADAHLVAFLDHDDTWLPEKLERQVEALVDEPDASMVFCDVEILGRFPPGLYIDQRTVPARPSLAWLVTHRNCVITVSSVLVRKRAMEEIDLFDTRYSSCDDFDAWIKLRMRAPIIHLPEKLAAYRLHQYNVNYSVDRLRDNRLLTALIWRVWLESGWSDRLRILPTLARKLVGRIYLAAKAHPRPLSL